MKKYYFSVLNHLQLILELNRCRFIFIISYFKCNIAIDSQLCYNHRK